MENVPFKQQFIIIIQLFRFRHFDIWRVCGLLIITIIFQKCYLPAKYLYIYKF